MKTLTEGDLHGLVRLLGDDDDWTFQIARNTLLEIGEAARPYLETGCNHPDPTVRARSRHLLENFAWERLRWEWHRFVATPNPDLEQGVLYLGRFAEPDLDVGWVSGELDRLAGELRTLVRPGEEVRAAAPALARFFHEHHGFDGNRDDYENPDNSYIQRVLTSKRGLPIALSCIYVLVSRRVGLPVAGIGMPGHFLVRYGAPESTHVFLDPFHGGRLLTGQSCLRWLGARGFEADLRYLATTPDRLILARMLANLINHHRRRLEFQAADRLLELRNMLLGNR
jgi:regulator of sirC expression with transglutaminase-like and TPR domain